MSATGADAPARQLARVKNGQEVGVITLPCRHRILADASAAPGKKALVCRINSSGAYCWHRTMYASALKSYLTRSNGEISTANTRDACEGWPSRYTNIGRRRA